MPTIVSCLKVRVVGLGRRAGSPPLSAGIAAPKPCPLLFRRAARHPGDGYPHTREALSKGSNLGRLWCAYNGGYFLQQCFYFVASCNIL